MKKRVAGAMIVAVGFGVWCAPIARAGDYVFTKIAGTDGPFSAFSEDTVVGLFVGSPSINNAGLVVFKGDLDTGGEGIFVGSGVPVTTIATSAGGSFLGFRDTPSINDQGTVTVVAFPTGGGMAIVTGIGGATATVEDQSGFVANFGQENINNGGQVVFAASEDTANVSGIYLDDGIFVTTIADSRGVFSNSFFNPSINEAGTVAFRGGLDAGGEGIFTGIGGAPTPIADSAGDFKTFGSPLINDAGTIAVVATLDAGGSGIHTFTGGVSEPVVDDSGPFSGFSRLGFNNSDQVAFDATLDAGGRGIFTGPDTTNDKVVAIGDALDGSSITNLQMGRDALNDLGQIVFWAALADMREVVFRADPDSDGDGVADVVDACPDDAAKTEAGVCGCGVAETDTDGDGTLDCEDGCPEDAEKIEAGMCGCGVAETDRDGDGTADCVDDCPDNGQKIEAGNCGCDVLDEDSDGDGVLDCDDGCPEDANKAAEGACGCGVADTDGDGDGTADCLDECPDDAGKTGPGACGCGVADSDANGNGVADCNDTNGSAGGPCGAGVALAFMMTLVALCGVQIGRRSNFYPGVDGSEFSEVN